MKIITTLIALSILLTATVAGADDDNDYLGQLSANPYEPDSVSNPYGEYGNPYETDSVNNPYGDYGSPFSNKSVSNPYATDAPKLYDEDGNYRGRLSSNPFDAESISNPYGQYGSKYSPDSIKNPYGAGSPYRADSPTNPYGKGIGIYDSESDGPTEASDDAFAQPAWSSSTDAFNAFDADEPEQ